MLWFKLILQIMHICFGDGVSSIWVAFLSALNSLFNIISILEQSLFIHSTSFFITCLFRKSPWFLFFKLSWALHSFGVLFLGSRQMIAIAGWELTRDFKISESNWAAQDIPRLPQTLWDWREINGSHTPHAGSLFLSSHSKPGNLCASRSLPFKFLRATWG